MASIETGRKSRAGRPLPDIPDKLYFRIGEVARLLALPAYVLRFWETEFPQLKPSKGDTGQRLYRRRDLDTLLEIRRLLYDQGYTIPGARQFLKDGAQLAEAPQPEVQATGTGPSEIPIAASLDAEFSEPSDAIAVLLQLRSELRQVAGLLAHSVSEVQRSNPAHRGLHLAAAKRRNAVEDAPTLFALGQETEEQGTE